MCRSVRVQGVSEHDQHPVCNAQWWLTPEWSSVVVARMGCVHRGRRGDRSHPPESSGHRARHGSGISVGTSAIGMDLPDPVGEIPLLELALGE